MKFGLSGIPRERLLVYLLLLGVLPIVWSIAHNMTQNRRIADAESVIAAVRHRAVLKQQKQALNTLTRQVYATADHFYIDKYLEAFTPCQEEAAGLAQLTRDDPSLPNRDVLKRLEFLEGPENQLRFAAGTVETVGNMRESVEALVRPVEIAQCDLPQILARLEGRAPGTSPPQLVVTEFSLHRKRAQGDNEVFLLDLKLIKREFS